MEQQFPCKLKTIRPGDKAFPSQLLPKRIPNTVGVYAADEFGHYMIQKHICDGMLLSIHHLNLCCPMQWHALPMRQAFYLTTTMHSNSFNAESPQAGGAISPGVYKVIYCPGKRIETGMQPGEYEFFQVRIPMGRMSMEKNRYTKIDWLLQYAGEGLGQEMQQITFPVPPEMISLYNTIIDELRKLIPSKLVIENALWSMMVMYASALHHELNHSMVQDRPLNQRIIDYIRSRPGQPVKVAMLAAHCLMSLTSFKKLCQQQLGMPPGEFIRLQCLEWAAELLLEHPDTMVEEIVWQVGFHDADNFRNHFKAHFKQTPTAWRLNAQRELP